MDYLLALLVIGLVMSVVVQSYNLSFGLTGLFNLGHIVFYGVGAYTAAILNTHPAFIVQNGAETQKMFGFFLSLPIAAIVSGIVAAGFGFLTLRLSGHYLAIATLGAAMIATVVATNWMDLTNGPLGIRGIDNPMIGSFEFSQEWTICLLYLGVAIICHWILWKIFHSPFGRLQRAIQDDEIAAKSLGKNTFEAKMWSLVLSAAFAGIGGVMYSHYRVFLDPTVFILHDIVILLLMLVVGGRGNFWGAILGSALVLAIGEIPRFVGFPPQIIGPSRNILFAVLLMVTMYWKPEGLFTAFGRGRKQVVSSK